MARPAVAAPVSWHRETDDGLWLVAVCRLTGKKVALKEIRLQPEEGTPFTAIREGETDLSPLHSSDGLVVSNCL